MNSDAQVEINMFLRATEMNQANINLGGFFDVNRTLFKSVSISYCRKWLRYFIRECDIFSSFFSSTSSLYLQSNIFRIISLHLNKHSSLSCWMDGKIKLLATMVTYLVVLLQFQISIPTEEPAVMTTFITKNISYYES